MERQVNPLDNLKAARAVYLVNLKVVRAGCLVSLKARVHPPGCSVNLQAVLASGMQDSLGNVTGVVFFGCLWALKMYSLPILSTIQGKRERKGKFF